MSDTLTVLPTAVRSWRLWIMTSYQWSVGPWIGRPGVDDASNENATMKTIGR